MCCVAVNLGNSQENFIEGQLDIFSGGDLGECYNFEVGTLASSDQFGKGTFINDVTQPGKGYGATSNRLFSYFPPFFLCPKSRHLSCLVMHVLLISMKDNIVYQTIFFMSNVRNQE